MKFYLTTNIWCLFQQTLWFTINDLFQEPAEPTEEIINKLGQAEGNKSIILPLGWIHYFFTDLDINPLRELFPNPPSIDGKGIFKNRRVKKKEKSIVTQKEHTINELDSKPLDLSFLKVQMEVDRYLSTESPIMHMEGLIFKPEDENGLKNWWIRSRFDRWSWLDTGTGGFQGKALVRSLVIDRKNGFYTTDFKKYYGTEFGFYNMEKIPSHMQP